jgi:hypothetical protein
MNGRIYCRAMTARCEVDHDGGKTRASWYRMNGQDETLTLERFESLLDAYGGDLSRWPAASGRAAEALIATSREARARHVEAQGLDLLLAKASRPSPERLSLLADRIVAAAGGDTRQQERAERGAGADILQLPVGRIGGKGRTPPSVGQDAVGETASVAARRPRAPWRAMTALAASLAFGIVIGLSDFVPASAVNIGAWFDAAGDSEIVLSGLQLDSLSMLDEDQI